MKILYVSHSFPTDDDPGTNIGGMQRVAVDIYESFKNHPQMEIHELILKTSWNTTHLKAPWFVLKLFWQIPKLVKKYDIEAVFFTAIVTGGVTRFIQKKIERLGAKTFIILYGRDILLPNPLYQKLLPKLFKNTNAFFPISSATAEQALARGFPKEKVFVVPMGIDLTRFGVSVNKENARKVLLETYPTQTQNPFILCSVGRHVKRKGFAWFTDTVMPLLPENIEYWIAGDGPERPNIEATIENKNLAHRVKLLGKISDEMLETLYQGADLFIMPNIHVPGDMEGFGVVMLEGGICGLPVVAANLEGIKDVVHEGKNGQLLPSEDSEAFVQTILAYAQNPEKLKQASDRAIAYIPKTFSWQGVAQRYLELMQKFIQPK